MLTVLFATKNRARILQDVLDSFCNLQEPAFGWKLVVVDNGSSDETANVIRSFADRIPIHYVLESEPGKNSALNAGLNLIDGDLTILTDDDVFPRPDWLIRMREAADGHPEFSIFGGVVVSRWETPPPSWARWSELGAAYGVSAPSAEEGPIPHGLLPGTIVGPNMAIRSAIFDLGARFDPSIGPRGNSYAMGSETEIILRLSNQGHIAWHVHGSVVEHLVRSEQLDKRWMLQRALRFGRGMLRQGPNVAMWFGIPRHLFRDIPKFGFLVVLGRLCGRADSEFQAHWFLNIARGKLIEAGNMRRERRELDAHGPSASKLRQRS